jgi:hypothetical protein
MYIRHKMVRPYTSGSYMHQTAIFYSDDGQGQQLCRTG